jgi:hypothetical protein
LSSPEIFIKNRRSELKELENTVIGYHSQQELLVSQREERAGKIAELQADTATVTAEIAELTAIRDSGLDRKAEEAALTGLRKRRAELLAEAVNNGADKATQGITSEIRESEKFTVKLEAKAYKSPYAKQIAEAEAALKALYDEHNRINTAMAKMAVGDKCPTCAVVITAENIEAVKAALQNELSILVGNGQTAKSRLTKLKAKDNADKDEFEENKAATLAAERDNLAGLNKQLQELNVARELDSQDYNERLLALDSQITEREYRLANGNLTQEQMARFAELETSKKEYAAKTEALNNITDYDYAPLIAEVEAETIRLKRLINEAIQYVTKRTELTLNDLKMSNTEIVLTEIIKTTGELKDCFRFSYEGRDYKCLSLSEKVRAGLDVAALIGRLSGRNYPVFVDNGESVCTFGKVQLPGQVIVARVVNNQPLQVTYRQREQARVTA